MLHVKFSYVGEEARTPLDLIFEEENLSNKSTFAGYTYQRFKMLAKAYQSVRESLGASQKNERAL